MRSIVLCLIALALGGCAVEKRKKPQSGCPLPTGDGVNVTELLGHEVPALSRTPEELATAQATQLTRLYYAETPVAERETADPCDFAEVPAREAAVLRAFYQDRTDFWALAAADSDDDGIRDFSVSEYFGKLFELDTDVDGDGVDNYRDADPFDAEVGEEDGDNDGIPDTIALEKTRSSAAAVQKRLLDHYGTLLVERDVEISETTAETLAFVLFEVLDKQLKAQARRDGPLIRAVVLEENVLLLHDEANATFGAMDPYARVLSLYQPTLEAEGALQFAVLLHEVAHAFQIGMDSYRRSYREPPPPGELLIEGQKFLDLVGTFGWNWEPGELWEPFSTFHGTWDDGQAFAYGFRGKTTDEWGTFLESHREAFAKDPQGKSHYLRTPEVAEHFVVNDYSLKDPAEFHAEVMVAAFFLAAQDRHAHHLEGADGLAPEQAALQAQKDFDEILDGNSGYRATRYDAVRGAPYLKHFQDWLALTPETLDAFLENYVWDEDSGGTAAE